MGNITQMRKAKAKELIEFYFNSNLKFSLETAKESAKKNVDDMLSYYEDKKLDSAVDFWKGVKPEIANYEQQKTEVASENDYEIPS
jgi:gas vesicle protein